MSAAASIAAFATVIWRAAISGACMKLRPIGPCAVYRSPRFKGVVQPVHLRLQHPSARNQVHGENRQFHEIDAKFLSLVEVFPGSIEIDVFQNSARKPTPRTAAIVWPPRFWKVARPTPRNIGRGWIGVQYVPTERKDHC